jgi:glutaredoxin
MTDPTTITAAKCDHKVRYVDPVAYVVREYTASEADCPHCLRAQLAARAAGYTPGERMPPKDGTKFAAEVAGDVVLLWWDEHDCDFKEHTLRRGLREIRRWWELPGTGGQQ